MKIAAAAYNPEWHDDWDALSAKLDAWVADAAGQGADLLVFPEYGGVEAGLTGARIKRLSPTAWRDRIAGEAERWAALHQALAARHDVHILSGSLPVATDAGVVNRAYFHAPGQPLAWQDKMIMTPYERREMHLVNGTDLKLFETALGKIGVLICYDSEFPLLARALVEAEADMILVPSCTDLPAGHTRVSQSCRARAIEGQCLIVQSPLVGDIPDCQIVDENTGWAGFYCPPDLGLPSDGIIAQGVPDVPGWTIAEVDPTAIAAPRATGQVGNFSHWTEQDDRINSITRLPLA